MCHTNVNGIKNIFFLIMYIIYNRAMASSSGKEQFLKQFETIVAGVKRNKGMVIYKMMNQ